jgi:hypothetical protein
MTITAAAGTPTTPLGARHLTQPPQNYLLRTFKGAFQQPARQPPGLADAASPSNAGSQTGRNPRLQRT